MDLFHSLDNLKNQLASVAFCRNIEIFNVRSGAVIKLLVHVSINVLSPHLCVWQSCAMCTDAYVKCTCIFVCRGVHAASYFVRMCNSHSVMLQYSSETLRKTEVNWSIPPKRVRKVFIFILFMLQQFVVMQLQLSSQP